MKVIVTTTGTTLDSAIDSRFGRGAYFLLVDTDSLETHAFPNPAASAGGGAGTKAAQFVAKQGAQAVISGDFGPNAQQVLNAANIAMYLHGSSHTAQEAIQQFKDRQLSSVEAA